MRKGWFVIPGVQDGDRTLEDQALALKLALSEAAGKSVLDMGCAEGLIAREFARAGAKVVAVEANAETYQVAVEHAAHEGVEYRLANLEKLSLTEPTESFDVVVALGVIHKVRHPERALHYLLAQCRSLFLLRSGTKSRNGVITHKRDPSIKVNAHKVLRDAGFRLDAAVDGAKQWNETVEYWRR